MPCQDCGDPNNECTSISNITWDLAITTCMNQLGITGQPGTISTGVVINAIGNAVCTLINEQCEFCLPTGTEAGQITIWNGSTWVIGDETNFFNADLLADADHTHDANAFSTTVDDSEFLEWNFNDHLLLEGRSGVATLYTNSTKRITNTVDQWFVNGLTESGNSFIDFVAENFYELGMNDAAGDNGVDMYIEPALFDMIIFDEDGNSTELIQDGTSIGFNSNYSGLAATFEIGTNPGQIAFGADDSIALTSLTTSIVDQILFEIGNGAATFINLDMVGLVSTYGIVSQADYVKIDNITHFVDLRTSGNLKINGTNGFTGTGIYTHFTIVKGIITAAS